MLPSYELGGAGLETGVIDTEGQVGVGIAGKEQTPGQHVKLVLSEP